MFGNHKPYTEQQKLLTEEDIKALFKQLNQVKHIQEEPLENDKEFLSQIENKIDCYFKKQKQQPSLAIIRELYNIAEEMEKKEPDNNTNPKNHPR